MPRSLVLIIALLAAAIPSNAQIPPPNETDAAELSRSIETERQEELHEDSADQDDRYIFLPVIHSPSPYPSTPPQIEPGVGDHFPCDTCPGSASHWLLSDRHLDYEVVQDTPWCHPWCDLEPGDVVIEITVRIENDSDVGYYASMGGTSYDTEGNHLTGTVFAGAPHPNTQLVPAHGTDEFTFHMKSHHAISLIRLRVGESIMPPP